MLLAYPPLVALYRTPLRRPIEQHQNSAVGVYSIILGNVYAGHAKANALIFAYSLSMEKLM